QQRVSIARALAKRPDLLLADEPTGALDIEMARNVLETLQRLNREQGLTIMLITHNPALASIATRVVRLVSGRIAEVTRNTTPAPAAEIAW
ncbi:MAG: macrolide ABC transporter ATP-binding protein, partial [Phycisphaerales bacterium]|nr:macrolide ABC transporter ATP-binding protein [Phycisphaerales bacterium]